MAPKPRGSATAPPAVTAPPAGTEATEPPEPEFPPDYPQSAECDVVLADGGTVHIRPIRPDDGDRLIAFHEQLSDETVYRRFFSAHRHLTPTEVQRFTHVDYRNRLALVALLDDELVAVARFDRDGQRAEVAFVVADSQQGRGLGTLLLEHLATAARRVGVASFFADTLYSNTPMLKVFHDAGFREHREVADGIVRVSFPIARTEDYQVAVDERDRQAQANSMARLLNPRSIAVVGASRRPGTIGHELLRNLIGGGFTGVLTAVNPAAETILGVPCFPSLAEVPGPIDVVVVAVPSRHVADVVDQAGRRHAHAAVVISAGFAEGGASGAAAERDLVALARRHGMRLVGPNCLGILNSDPAIAMNATFSPARPSPGRTAFLSQSGALGIAVLDRARQRGLGVSSFVSVGNKADVSGNDLLEYWETDPRTGVVLLYLESFGNPRKFARVARRVSRAKPIVAVKSGRSRAGRRAAQSHTAAAATPDVAVDALFGQTGVIRVDTLSELLDTAALLSSQPLPAGPRVAVVGNSGGPGILAADACASRGLEVPELSATTQDALRSFLPPEASVTNPVDLVASARGEDYERAVELVLDDDQVDAVVVVFTPTLVTELRDVAAAVARVARRRTDKPLLANFLTFAGTPDELSGDEHGDGAVPCYPFPEQAVMALARAVRYAEWRGSPLGRVPTLEGTDPSLAGAIVDDVLAGHPEGAWLPPDLAGSLLHAYGIELVATRRVSSVDEALDALGEFQGPVALKAFGPGLVHKTEAGAVRLGLASPAEVGDAFESMASSLGPQMEGAVVQPMVPAGVETIVGLIQDPSFGPLVMFGLGGVTTDLLNDRAFRILPMTDRDAAELIRSVRAAPLLTGYRGAPPTDVRALQDLLLRVGRLGEDHPEITEIDLNPVIVTPEGVCTVDAKVRVAPAAATPDPTQRRLR